VYVAVADGAGLDVDLNFTRFGLGGGDVGIFKFANVG
jgi:hypothetical protein